MIITKIDGSNLAANLADLISLLDDFLELIGEETDRSRSEKISIIEEMVNDHPSTTLLLAQEDDGNAIGVSYYNYGSGYSCGGAYLWLNGIYIRQENQKRGYGSKLLKYIEEDGRKKGIKLFICNRHIENEAAKRLFEKSEFQQEESVIMTKQTEGLLKAEGGRQKAEG